ncbi:hypothetical protein [Mariniphaga sp.]|uniref:hypothetical protein n=1 Tax=Mariniphaga sp. TaxID=1954475 RepID=UPI003565B157
MESEKILKVCGSITKKESLALITSNILENTVVAEADMPYSNYYGRIPDKPQPNSLFLFTEGFYTLEEALRLTQNIDICAKNKVNTASAIFLHQGHHIPAIRIRNFPDYQHLKMLQECYIKLGVKFARKVQLEKEAVVTVSKCFFLEDKGDGIFFDKQEKHEGYINLPKRPELSKFEKLMEKVKNNSDCLFFDGAIGGLIIDGKVQDIMRVYSEHLDLKMLTCIKTEVLKWI